MPIDADFKGAAAGRNELERTDALFQFENFRRQTDGFGFVVSSGAIFDGDFDAHIFLWSQSRTHDSRRQEGRGRQLRSNPIEAGLKVLPKRW